MTAQEMFEKLGYRKNKSIYYNNNNFIYEKPVGDCEIFTVQFSENNSTYYECNPRGVVVKSLSGTYFISPELHKAINKQLKELGWLDE